MGLEESGMASSNDRPLVIANLRESGRERERHGGTKRGGGRVRERERGRGREGKGWRENSTDKCRAVCYASTSTVCFS